jgi:hypothetical protein
MSKITPVATPIRLGNSNFNPEKTTPEPKTNCFGTLVQDKTIVYQGLMVASTVLRQRVNQVTYARGLNIAAHINYKPP